MKAGRKWIFFRLGVIALISYSVFSVPEQQSNVDWPLGFLIGPVCAVFLCVWLAAMRYAPRADWSFPYSLEQPFFPMLRFPFQYWLLVSCGLTIGGVALTIRDLFRTTGHEWFGGTFVIWGLVMGGALVLWAKIFLPVARTN
jgi:hypothetical protein